MMARGSSFSRSHLRTNGVKRTTTTTSKKSGKPKKWIKAAHLKKGTFTKYCVAKGYGGVTKKCIAEGKKSSDPKTRKRAVLAQTFKKMARKNEKKRK